MKFPEVITYMEIRIACYVYFQGKNLIERLHVTAAVQNLSLIHIFYKQLYGEVLYKIIDNIPLFLDKKALK